MEVLLEISAWTYNYCLDFCINMSYLLGIDYVTFGSLFFGYFMNGVLLLLLFLNLIQLLKNKKKNEKTNAELK